MASDSPSSSAQRLVSLDALRGFDMCWILGLGGVFEALAKQFIPGTALAQLIDTQFKHVNWEGFHFEDLIFPLFLFIAGVSMPLALPKRVARDGRIGAMKHLIIRALIIFVLGVIYSGGMSKGFDNIRWMGVLQRIGIASAVAGMLSLVLQTRGLVVATISLLISYWLMLKFIPVPGLGAGDFTEGHNLTNYLDKIWLPGRKYNGDHDPEGILSTIPAIATALLGVLAGRWIISPATVGRKALMLIMAGVVLLCIGWAWSPFFPVVKKLWSSSFVLVAGGWSAILLGVFYYVIDGLNWKRWTTPFVWVGANPIALYLASGLGFFKALSDRLAGHPEGAWSCLVPVASFAVMLLTAGWLYRRGIYIRI